MHSSCIDPVYSAPFKSLSVEGCGKASLEDRVYAASCCLDGPAVTPYLCNALFRLPMQLGEVGHE